MGHLGSESPSLALEGNVSSLDNRISFTYLQLGSLVVLGWNNRSRLLALHLHFAELDTKSIRFRVHLFCH